MGSPQAPYNVRVEELNLTVRCYNALKRDGIDTVGQVAMRSEEYLLGLRNLTPKTMDELKVKLADLGLFPWDARRSDVASQAAADRATGSRPPAQARGAQVPGLGRPGWLSLRALSAAGALLPADERDRWVEEWKAELQALGSRTARARFVVSLLFAGGRKLAVTLRQVWPGEKPVWPRS